MSKENKQNRTYDEIRLVHSEADSADYELFGSGSQGIMYRDQNKVFRSESGVWTDQYLREQYIKETGQLIGVIDGRVPLNEIKGDIVDARYEGDSRVPDSVIWLDKSARPVSWFVDAFWEQLAKDDAQKPNYEFLNIDRTNWFVQLGHDIATASRRLGRDDFDINEVNPDQIAAIRAYFSVGELDESSWKDKVWGMPTKLDGQHVLIVDEVRNQGGTLYIATELLKRAIPEATFDGTYFWHAGRISIDGISADSSSQQLDSVPFWYDNKDPMGRGVGDISIDYYNKLYEREPTQENLRKKIAAFSLSAPHHDASRGYELIDDTAAKKLLQDIAFATYAMAAGKLLNIPSKEFEIDEMMAQFEKQGLSRSEAIELIQNRARDNLDTQRGKR